MFIAEFKGNFLWSWLENSNKWKCNTPSAFIVQNIISNSNNKEYEIKLGGMVEKNNIKLIGWNGWHHESKISPFTPEECWKKCDQDKKCYAFQTNSNLEWAKNKCFLYGETFESVKGI